MQYVIDASLNPLLMFVLWDILLCMCVCVCGRTNENEVKAVIEKL